MTNLRVAAILIVSALLFGLALSRTSFAYWESWVLGGLWLVLGLLALRDNRRSHRDGDRFRTPRSGIYQVLPPPTYVRDRQYPRSHFDIVENSPQNPIE